LTPIFNLINDENLWSRDRRRIGLAGSGLAGSVTAPATATPDIALVRAAVCKRETAALAQDGQARGQEDEVHSRTVPAA
jgi:hypothetical protein